MINEPQPETYTDEKGIEYGNYGKLLKKSSIIGESLMDMVEYIIPDSVTIIEKGAFKYCYNLESITIPDSVTEIGDEAFAGCMNLRSIKVSDHVNKNALQSILNDLERDIERLHRLREQLTTART